MIIDGREMAKGVLARTKERVESLGRTPRVAVFVTSETPATKSYLAIKTKRATDAGCVLEIHQFSESATTLELQTAIQASSADAIIVQLPLPEHIDTKEVCDAILVAKDADILSSSARAHIELLPPVVAAVREIFIQNAIEVKGKRAVVIGAGFLVGAPCATWLREQGAEVSVVTSGSGSLTDALQEADIIISGAGSPHLIKPSMLKQGVVLIDAGTSESGGEVVGDADPACASVCALFTPVPGGMGPLAVACLFENVMLLTEKAIES